MRLLSSKLPRFQTDEMIEALKEKTKIGIRQSYAHWKDFYLFSLP